MIINNKNEINNFNYNDILDIISQEDIFKYYLGNQIVLNKAIYRSPFRKKDSEPGCRFVFKNKWLYFIDNATYMGKLMFNCFELVQYMYNVDFNTACSKISYDLKLSKISPGDYKRLNYDNLREISNSKFKSVIKFDYVKWNKHNNVFNKYDLPYSYLNEQNSYKVNNYWFNSKNNWIVRKNPLGKLNNTVGYIFDNKRVKLRFYDLKEKKRRFICNTTKEDIFGYHRVGDYLDSNKEVLFITKSGIDEMLLNYHFKYATLANQNETGSLPDKIASILKYFKKVYIIYDNDKTGIEKSKKLRDVINSHFPNLATILFFIENDGCEQYLKDKKLFFKIINDLKV